jgi:hypothetical protein
MLQQIPNRIVGTFAIANMSNVELYWDHVYFEPGVQFPLIFTVVLTNNVITNNTYVIQLNIYQIPRSAYDLPLWSADTITNLRPYTNPNIVYLTAHTDRK